MCKQEVHKKKPVHLIVQKAFLSKDNSCWTFTFNILGHWWSSIPHCSGKNMEQSATGSDIITNAERILFQNLTNLDRSRSIRIDLDLSDEIDPVRWKKCTDQIISGRGHLVLVCTERRGPRPLLQLNRTRTPGRHKWAQLSQIFSDVSEQIRLWLRTRSVSLGSI